MATDSETYLVRQGDGGWYQIANKLSRQRGYTIDWRELRRLNPQCGDFLWGSGKELLRVPRRPGEPRLISRPSIDTLPTGRTGASRLLTRPAIDTLPTGRTGSADPYRFQPEQLDLAPEHEI